MQIGSTKKLQIRFLPKKLNLLKQSANSPANIKEKPAIDPEKSIKYFLANRLAKNFASRC